PLPPGFFGAVADGPRQRPGLYHTDHHHRYQQYLHSLSEQHAKRGVEKWLLLQKQDPAPRSPKVSASIRYIPAPGYLRISALWLCLPWRWWASFPSLLWAS